MCTSVHRSFLMRGLVTHHGRTFTPLISVVYHPDWPHHGQLGPAADGWSFSPTSTGRCSLHNLFLQPIPLFSSMLVFSPSQSLTIHMLFQPTHYCFVFFAVQQTHWILLSPYIRKMSTHFDSLLLNVKHSQLYVAIGRSQELLLDVSWLRPLCCDFSHFLQWCLNRRWKYLKRLSGY